jgi:predicted Zn-dependent protease
MASFSIDNISITLWNWIFLGFALGGVFNVGLTGTTDNLDVKTKRVRQPQPSLYDFGRVLATLLSISIFFFGWTSASADRKIVSALRTPASFSQPETINARLFYLGDISRLRVLDPQHYLTIARALVELQQIPQSIEVLSKGVAEYPRDFALWDSLAYSLEQQSRIPEAVSAREKQLTLDPRHARVWSYLAQDYLKNNDLINAKEAAKKSLENLPIFAPEDQNSIKNFLIQLNLI